MAQKAVKLHGWVYDIKTGEVSAFDDTSGTWVPVEERYASEIAELMVGQHAC